MQYTRITRTHTHIGGCFSLYCTTDCLQKNITHHEKDLRLLNQTCSDFSMANTSLLEPGLFSSQEPRSWCVRRKNFSEPTFLPAHCFFFYFLRTLVVELVTYLLVIVMLLPFFCSSTNSGMFPTYRSNLLTTTSSCEEGCRK